MKKGEFRKRLTVTLITIALSAHSAPAQTQTKDQQKCTAAAYKGLVKIAGSLAKDIGTCIKDGSKGELSGTIEACTLADRAGKVAKAVSKSEDKFARRCNGASTDPPLPRLPPFGVTDPAIIAAAAAELATDQIHDLFGANLDAAIVTSGAHTTAAACQESVAKQAKKCEAARLKAFLACAKNGLKDEIAPIDAADDLAACIGTDPKGKVARKCDLQEVAGDGKVDGIRKALANKCSANEVDLTAAFPGCAQADPEQTHACIDTAIECRVCLAVNRAGNLTRDCDTLDDGLANESCVAPVVIGRHTCTLTPDTAGFFFETAAFFDSFLLNGALDIDCGGVDRTTGRAPCACNLTRLDPVPIVPGLGFACVYPAAGCAAGGMSCNGGDLLNNTITSTHNIGTCASNAACAASCASACAAHGAAILDSACEGFCRDGSNANSACASDAECPAGTCNGLDGAPHGNACQCQCLDRAGDPSRPGGLSCNVGVDIVVETALPCGDGDAQFRVGDRCVPFSTETTEATIVNANDVLGERIPEGREILGGVPLTCDQLMADGPSGMAMVASVNILDVQRAGDIAFNFFLGCE